MAITKAEVQILWSGGFSVSLGPASTATSDAFTFDATSFNAMLQVKADNQGSPASGDVLDVYLLYTLGDPDGAGADEYDSSTLGTYLGQLDTNTTDPAIRTWAINPSAKGGKLYVFNASAGRTMAVSATMYETRG